MATIPRYVWTLTRAARPGGVWVTAERQAGHSRSIGYCLRNRLASMKTNYVLVVNRAGRARLKKYDFT